MGRKSKTLEEKKGKLSVTVSIENFDKMENEGLNKSKLVNWLLEQHFIQLSYGK